MTTDLIKRLTEATEGSRELDADIANYVFGDKGWRALPDGNAEALMDHPDGEGWIDCGEVPDYTTSLDAAKTLLPEGAFYRVGNDGEGQNPGDFRADVVTARGSFHAVAQTDALALSSAALKAKDQS